MLPTFDLSRVSLERGRTLAVLAPRAQDTLVPRTGMWRCWEPIIAHYAGVHELAITRTANGKPMLAPSLRLWFNVSHGARSSLLALSRSADLGCDVEDRLVPEDRERLASIVLHGNERASIDALTHEERTGAFARCWVRKEAILKAIGTGFGADPRRFDVRLASENRPVRIEAEGGWWLHDLGHGGIPAAVASRDHDCDWFVFQPPP